MAGGILQSIDSNRQHVLKYEDPVFQDKVLTTVPLRELHEAAGKAATAKGLTFHEHFIKQVMEWFKKDFFSWVDCKPCASCGASSAHDGQLEPTAEERKSGAGRVECHKCTVCGTIQRFPRYNCPIKLLDTREGRCGEWANCFTGICRALGYDARYIHDVTDHVWTEVFSPHLDRWVHMDPCENAWDRPLVYEQGWKKELSFVIAFSKDEVVDVTYRYTLDPATVRARRVEEASVQKRLVECNNLFFNRHSPAKKEELRKRLAKEMISMLSKPNLGGEAYSGRESGSAEWRASRGEGGAAQHASSNVIQCEGARLVVKYSPAEDKYTVLQDGGPEQVHGSFASLAYRCQDVVRKVEYDWNMAYLARAHSGPAYIEWRVECKNPIKSVEISMLHKTFHNGEVMWSCGPSDQPEQCHAQFSDIDLSTLVGQTSFKISAKLSSSGAADNSWQHSQLFRTELNGQEHPFYIKLEV